MDTFDIYNRKVVCRRCHCIMVDYEPMSSDGEFWHPDKNKKGKPHNCKNAGKRFSLSDTKEIMPFERKKIRRAAKRAGTKV